MGRAVGIASNNQSNIPILDLWDQIGKFEEIPSMRSLEYLPHFTFGIYQNIGSNELRKALKGVFAECRQIQITFDKIRCFEASPLVLWASPQNNYELAELHSAIHAKVDPKLCHEHYRPNRWVAHCTLGTQIQDAHRAAALSLVSHVIEPFEVAFDTIDILDFPPVKIAERIILKPQA